MATAPDISTNDTVYNQSEEIETSNHILRGGQSTGNSSRESNSLESPQQEEAKLQAELNIRQMAEDEFLLLSNDR